MAALPDARRDTGIFVAVCDLIAGALIYIITRRPLAAALYLLNPVVLANGGFVAQFEPYALIPLLLAILDENPNCSWLWATLAILVKQDMLFLAWCIIVYRFPPRKALMALALSGIIFALTLLPYALDGGLSGILSNVVAYQGSLLNLYGLSPLLSSRIVSILALVILFPLPFFLRFRRLPLDNARFRSSGLAYVPSLPGYGPNDFIPCIAVWAIADSKWLRLFSVFMLGISLTYFIQPEPRILAIVRNVSLIALWVTLAWAFGLSLIRYRRAGYVGDAIPSLSG